MLGKGVIWEAELHSSVGALELLAPLHKQTTCLLLFSQKCQGFAQAAAVCWLGEPLPVSGSKLCLKAQQDSVCSWCLL